MHIGACRPTVQQHTLKSHIMVSGILLCCLRTHARRHAYTHTHTHTHIHTHTYRHTSTQIAIDSSLQYEMRPLTDVSCAPALGGVPSPGSSDTVWTFGRSLPGGLERTHRKINIIFLCILKVCVYFKVCVFLKVCLFSGCVFKGMCILRCVYFKGVCIFTVCILRCVCILNVCVDFKGVYLKVCVF